MSNAQRPDSPGWRLPSRPWYRYAGYTGHLFAQTALERRSRHCQSGSFERMSPVASTGVGGSLRFADPSGGDSPGTGTSPKGGMAPAGVAGTQKWAAESEHKPLPASRSTDGSLPGADRLSGRISSASPRSGRAAGGGANSTERVRSQLEPPE